MPLVCSLALMLAASTDNLFGRTVPCIFSHINPACHVRVEKLLDQVPAVGLSR